MIPRLPKPEKERILVTLSRFDFEKTKEFLEKISRIGVESKKKTETERRIGRIAYSIRNDFKPGFSERVHGDDAKSIAKKQIDWLIPRIHKERTEVQVKQLQQEVESLRELLAHKESTLAEVDNSRGSSVFHQRRMEIEKARKAANG